MTDGVAAALAATVEGVADALADVERVGDGRAVELRRAGRAFARLEPAGVSFRLAAPIAAAAMRTPGAAATALGADWVAFHPGRLDRFALDRATSWTELAWRHAADRA